MSYETISTAGGLCPGNDVAPLQDGLTTTPDASGYVRLIGSECGDCGETMFPPREQCVRCYRGRVQERQLSGEGKVTSYTIIRQAPPGYWGPTPYVLGMVELGDGLEVLTHLIGKPVEDWKVGDVVSSCAALLQLDEPGERIVMSYAFRAA